MPAGTARAKSYPSPLAGTVLKTQRRIWKRHYRHISKPFSVRIKWRPEASPSNHNSLLNQQGRATEFLRRPLAKRGFGCFSRSRFHFAPFSGFGCAFQECVPRGTLFSAIRYAKRLSSSIPFPAVSLALSLMPRRLLLCALKGFPGSQNQAELRVILSPLDS